MGFINKNLIFGTNLYLIETLMRDQKTHLILNNFKWYVGLTSPFQSHWWWWWWWCHWWLSQGNVWQATTQEFGPNLILGILASRPVRGLGAQVPAAIIICMKIRSGVEFWTNIMSDYEEGSTMLWSGLGLDWSTTRFRRWRTSSWSSSDMRFVQNFTPPDFQAKNFTPLISLNFNSFSDKNTKN